MAKAQGPELTTLTNAQLEQLLAELRPLLPAATYQLVEALLQTLQWIMAAFEQKAISIVRLKRMLFGHATEMTARCWASKTELVVENQSSGRPEEGAHQLSVKLPVMQCWGGGRVVGG